MRSLFAVSGQIGDNQRMRVWCLLLLPVLLSSCGSAGPYGFSRTYTPLSEEQSAATGAKEYDPVMSERARAEWLQQRISAFGVVTARKPGKDGSYLTLSVRTLADRNLCDDMDESTCRVTISDQEHGTLRALVHLASSDETGPTSLGVGSLLRVIGQLAPEVDTTDGTQILKVSYYRHWPRNYYVTESARTQMRR